MANESAQPNVYTASGYGPGNPSPKLIDRYREVLQRPEVQGDANRAALLWDSQGRSNDWAGQNVYGNFVRMVGREPTEQELAQFIPIYQGSYNQGNAALANFAQYESQRPENLQKKAPQYADQVNQQFQGMLGRQATPEEINHFGGLLASGNTDAYQLQDFLRGTTEFQGAEDKKFRGGLASELEGYDTSFFNKAKENVISRFGDTGGLQNRSSALDFALTDLMGQIAEKRGSYLANLSSQQYGGNKDLALGNYRGAQDQYLNEMNQRRGNSYNQFLGNQNRANEIGDYYRQAEDYRQSQQGRDALHTRDWINLGLYAGNTTAQAYVASQTGGASMGGGGQQGQWNWMQ